MKPTKRDLITMLITVALTIGAQLAANQGINLQVPALCPEVGSP